MVGRAAGHDEDLVDVAQLLVGEALLVEHDPPVDEVPAQCVRQCGGLLLDLLLHEEVVAALLGGGDVPVDVEGAGTGDVAVEVGDDGALARQRDDLVLAELDGVAGVVDERRDVGGDEGLAVPDPDDQRRRPARGDDLVGALGVGEHEGERALEAVDHLADRRGEAGLRVLGDRPRDQVRRDLGVGLTGQLDAVVLELGAQRHEVLDDPVVDHRDAPARVPVRVRVAVGRCAVGGPAGVSHAGAGHRAVRLRCGVGDAHQVVQGSRGAVHVDGVRVGGHRRDARRVVSPVLQPPQTAQEDVACRAPAHVPHDAAHGLRG